MRVKCDSNGSKIAIFSKKLNPSSEGSVIRLSCTDFFSKGPKLDNFCAKKFTFGSGSNPHLLR